MVMEISKKYLTILGIPIRIIFCLLYNKYAEFIVTERNWQGTIIKIENCQSLPLPYIDLHA